MVTHPSSLMKCGANGESLLVKREATTLRQQATNLLRQAIIDQRFAPGTHLVERELCEMLGISRTSVREALRHLDSEGLIQTIPHKGPIVASITPDDARNIYEVRASLEGMAGELFVRNATPKMIKRMQKIGEDLCKACQRSDPTAILGMKSEFYEILFKGAQNPVCAQMIQFLNARIWLMRRLSVSAPGRMADMQIEVQAIIDAVSSKDPEAMKRACVRHVRSAGAVVLRRLAEDSEQGQQHEN